MNKMIIVLCIACFVYPKYAGAQQINRDRIYWGISAGNETFISLPRFGVCRDISMVGPSTYSMKRNQDASSFYVAADISLFGLVVMSITPSLYVGYRYQSISVDNSIAYTFGGVSNNQTYQYCSINPKIGLRLNRVWIKTGPSYTIWEKMQNDSPSNWMIISGQQFNVDFLVFMNPKKKNKNALIKWNK